MKHHSNGKCFSQSFVQEIGQLDKMYSQISIHQPLLKREVMALAELQKEKNAGDVATKKYAAIPF